MSQSRMPVFGLLAANLFSYIAEGIAMVAIPWFVFDLTGSAARVGLIGFFTFLPRVIATFFGGQLVDRIGFRTSSMAADVLSGTSVCGIPLLYASGHLTFMWLVVLVIVGAFFDGPGSTARQAMVPELTGAASMDLDRVNALFQGARRLSMFIGPVMAGFLVTWVGASNVLWVNATLFAAAVAATFFLIPEIRGDDGADADAATFWERSLFGLRFLRQDRLLFWLAGVVCLMNFLDAPLATVTLPSLVREYHGSAEQVGILLGAFGIGALVGTLIFSGVSSRIPRRLSFFTGFATMGAGMLVIAVIPEYLAMLVVLMLIGVASGPTNPILMSIQQERIPLAFRARVMGAITAIAFIAIPLGQLTGGYLIEWFGVRPYLALVSAVYLAALIAFILNPALHEMNQSGIGMRRPESASQVVLDRE